MSVWVQFLRDGATKQNYRDFKQIIEDDREKVRLKQQENRKETIGNMRNKFERMKMLIKKKPETIKPVKKVRKTKQPRPEGITFTLP